MHGGRVSIVAALIFGTKIINAAEFNQVNAVYAVAIDVLPLNFSLTR